MPTDDLPLQWYYFGFTDKSWVLPVYWLGLALVCVIARWISQAPPKSVPEALHRSTVSMPGEVFSIILIIACAWEFWGPPWNLHLNSVPVDIHETVHLGAIQALSQGAIPFTGATTQYGPGHQILLFKFLELTELSIRAMREFYAFSIFIAFALFGLAALWLLGSVWAWVALGLSFVYSPLVTYSFSKVGEYSVLFGWFGWAFPLRALAPLILMALIHTYLSRTLQLRDKARLAVWGFGIGGLTFLAQENLGAVLQLAVFSAAILHLVFRTELRQLFLIYTFLAVGAFLYWAPVLFFYARLGELQTFFELYMRMPTLGAQGYANIPWEGSYYFLAFIGTPAILAGVMLFSAVKARSGGQNMRLLALLAAAGLILHQSSLLRSDWLHLIGYSWALPILFALSLKLTSESSRSYIQAATRFVLIAVAYLMLFGDGAAVPSLMRREAPINESTSNARRIGFMYEGNRRCCDGLQCTWDELLHAVTTLRKTLGSRTIAAESAPGNAPGIFFFLGDLNVVGRYQDPVQTIVNSRLERQLLADLEEVNPDCIISLDASRWIPQMIRRTRGVPSVRAISAGSEKFYLICFP